MSLLLATSLAAAVPASRHAALLSSSNDTSSWPSESAQCTSEGDKKGCYPKLLMIGAMKAGTTSVFHALQEKKMVCPLSKDCVSEAKQADMGDGKFHISPNGGGKEPHLLGVQDKNWADVMDNKWKYYQCYQPSDCEARTFLDASPQYLVAPDAAVRLMEYLPPDWVPELKLVVVLREPIARALSHFNMAIQVQMLPLCSLGDERATPSKQTKFEDEMMCDHQRLDKCMKGDSSKKSVKLLANADLDMDGYYSCMESLPANDPITYSILGRSMYAPQLRAWHAPRMDKIKRSQVLVMTMDALIEEPKENLNVISNFYGLGNVDTDELPQSNSASDSGRGDIEAVKVVNCEVKKKMEEFYAPWNDQIVKDLKEARDSGDAPKEEPEFGGWKESSVECE